MINKLDLDGLLKEILKLLLDIKQDMKVIHNIEYSSAYKKINLIIDAINKIINYKSKPVRKFGIFSKSSK